MDIKNIVSIDNEKIWKSDHTSNPYAIVLNAAKIWKFTKNEWPEQYKFYSSLIKENAKDSSLLLDFLKRDTDTENPGLGAKGNRINIKKKTHKISDGVCKNKNHLNY